MAQRTRKIRKFTKPMQKKLTFLFGLVLLLLVSLNLFIARINIKSGDKYAKQVLSQQTYDSRSVPYRRGEITDRNGNVLAQSEKVYNVILDCYVINSDSSFVEPTIRAVAQYLGIKESEARAVITDEAYKESQYYVIREGISQEEKDAFEDYTDTSNEALTEEQVKERSKVKGVWFEETYVRSYPLKSLACTVIGYSTESNHGVFGLESYYDDVLNGVNGREYGYLDEDSQLQENVIDPENGNNIVSTIDINIQKVCEKYIAELEEENKKGPQEKTKGHASLHTGVIVANPNNGEILAMASDRSFDLNDPQNLSSYYTEAELKEIERETAKETKDEDKGKAESAALTNMWYNFCVSEAFELGSTYKPIVAAAALDCGSIEEDFETKCVGYLQPVKEEDSIACTAVHGKEGIKEIITYSCNPGMMSIGMAMGVKTFVKYQATFGFGKKTGIDLPNENSGSLYDENTMAIMELSTCSFGQGFTATMLQQLQSFNAVVNGGYLYKPHIVKQIQNESGEVVKNIDPILLSQPVSSKTSAKMKEYLEAVVTEGTAVEAQIPGYSIGGKTGTAEKLPRGNEKYIISYICAVPIEDPQVVVYAVIDEPNVKNQEAGTYTKQLTKKILQEILPYMGIYPTEEITDYQRDALGMQAETNEPETELVAQYVYDGYGNLCYDEVTWEPLTEYVAVPLTEEEIAQEEQTGNKYGNVAPPVKHEEDEVDENDADKANADELFVGLE